jgi:hypothetical protein
VIERMQYAIDNTMSMNISSGKIRLSGIVACLFLLTPLPVVAEARDNFNIPDVDLESLDKGFHQFSSHFYRMLVRTNHYAKIDTIDTLAKTVADYRTKNQPISATAAVISNLSLVESNIDTTPIIGISRLLLEENEWNTASQLYSEVKAKGDKALVSNVSLAMAEYYFSRAQWAKTIEIVESIRSDLPPDDQHHALLLHGVSLQRLQKHRLALVQYAKIPNTSRYYAPARLNMAVANIRQDWWTDAHILIHDLINDKTRNGNTALTDRLYTVLGYSLLQQQYFRNSRDAFRNVSLDSPYTNKALLGIALTAAYQEDYVGALNAIRILKDKPRHDLPVDEANLLLPVFYEKLRQTATASAGYLDAIKYYEARAVSINAAMLVDSDFIKKQLLAGGSSRATVKDEAVDLGDKLPQFFFDNIRLLALFEPDVNRIGDAALRREYAALDAAYKNALRKATQAVLNERASYITHYMNQSRYGLARMQDNAATIPH